MKKYLLISITCFLAFQSNAQFEDAGELLLASDPLFEERDIPEDWANESAVILGQKTRLLINRTSGGSGFEKYWVTRTKILLRDKAAVEFFSDFTVSAGDAFEMKVIKPDGAEFEVDTSDAIPVSQGFSLTSFYVNLSLDEVEYKKLAIQGLEVGDVIDYAYASKEFVDTRVRKSRFPIRLWNTGETFLTYSYTFGSSYPKLAQEFEIELSPELYFNFKSLNGAPEPSVSKLTNGNMRYVVAVDAMERIRNEYFTDEDISQPKIKFDISYCQDYRYYRSGLVIANQGKMNNELAMDQFKRSLFLGYHPSRLEVLDIFKFYERDPEKYLRKAYKKFQRLVYENEDDDYRQPSSVFALLMYAGLKKKGFDGEIVVCIPRQNGGLEDLLLKDDVFFGVRVKSGNGYIYSFPFKKVSGFDDWDYRVVGTKAFAFKPVKKIGKFNLKEIDIPEYKPEQNKTLVELTVNLEPEEMLAEIRSVSTHSGETKTLYASDILLRTDMYYNTDRFYTEKLERYFERKDRMEYLKRQEWLENEIEGDFDLGEYEDFELRYSGMEDESDALEYVEEYTVTDLVSKAADEFILVDVGRLITSQIALTAEDMERQSDVVSNYVREYEYHIKLSVPAGYKVLNPKDFEYSITTKAGTFSSSIDQEGEKVEVKTKKTYTTRALPKEEWNEMVKFLQTAHDFSQQKLILVKQ